MLQFGLKPGHPTWRYTRVSARNSSNISNNGGDVKRNIRSIHNTHIRSVQVSDTINKNNFTVRTFHNLYIQESAVVSGEDANIAQ
jgi:hypothetical protein